MLAFCGFTLIFPSILGVCLAAAEIGMPLIHISHGGHDDLTDDYPEVQEEVHLEDFFWTGSGDGPPDYLKKVHTGISKGKDVIVKTETVVATVYVEGNNEIDIPICLDCPPDDGGGGPGNSWGLDSVPPLNYSATDRRYWLLTVMSGFYTQKDNPGLEEKLAKLYRLAFTRQQSKHLGINGAQQIYGLSVPNNQKRSPREHINDYEILDMITNHTKTILQNHPPPSNVHSELTSSSDESDLLMTDASTESQLVSSTTTSSEESTADLTQYVTLIPWELIQNGDKLEKLTLNDRLKRLKLQQFPPLRDDRVRVVIHNITQITEDDIQKGKVPTNYDEDINEKIENRPIANQTEIIYSVFVNGRPVLAVAAANDMRLVTEAEVTSSIGKDIFMKAEPYLREPQATPLAPATHSSSAGFLDSFHNNPILVILTSVAILLLLLLLIALLLMGRSRIKQKTIETNRSASQNDLISESLSRSGRPLSSGMAIDTARSTARQSRDVGIQNISFDQERSRGFGDPRIHFPGPPNYERSPRRRASFTSSDNTSDSSVYCPINTPETIDVQSRLDEKAATLFDKHNKRHKYDRAEGHEKPIYTAVVSEKGRSKTGRKMKRKYLSENRVGSLENSPSQRLGLGHSSGDDITDATDSIDESQRMRATYENFERTEAFNPNNNYNRNKLLHQKTFYNDEHFEEIHTPEAINKEIIKALQPSRKSSDTGSIGSFLSMASVKAFPKSTLPEPLNKVLEPVFVTYYDNVEEHRTAAITQPSSSARSQKSQRSRRTHESDGGFDAQTIATIESFPSPKAPQSSASTTNRLLTSGSLSDNPDPGVIGPIVWERHKKRMKEIAETAHSRPSSVYSPIQDPAVMRNHYEGLLEGAIQMYSSQDDLPMPLPTRDFTNNRRPTKRELRGSSAGTSGCSSKVDQSSGRPATAQASKLPKSNQSTQPPSPATGAWGGSLHGSHSPLVRPLSAGPFHRPEIASTSSSGLSKSATSRAAAADAAPLIEALQKELRKYEGGKK